MNALKNDHQGKKILVRQNNISGVSNISFNREESALCRFCGFFYQLRPLTSNPETHLPILATLYIFFMLPDVLSLLVCCLLSFREYDYFEASLLHCFGPPMWINCIEHWNTVVCNMRMLCHQIASNLW